MNKYYIFKTLGNSKTSEPHSLILNLANKINLKKSNKYVALSNIWICYTWKNIR